MSTISLSPGSIFKMLKQTFNDWLEDNALRLSAALAYYSIFSIAPLLVIAIGVAGLVFGDEARTGLLQQQMTAYVGPKAAEGMQEMVANASKPSEGISATVIGFITLLIGASTVFAQLKDALNTIWEVKAKGGLGIWGFVRERLLSFSMVLVIGFLLLISLLAATAISGLGKFIPIHPVLLTLITLVISLAVETLLFATIFKVLPDAKIEWRQVWIGAGVTAILFEIGKWGLSIYLGKQSGDSSFGAAGSVVLLLLWVYYASAILFFGAEFTQVYAAESGHEIQPKENAVKVTTETREEPTTSDAAGIGSSGAGSARPRKETVAALAAPPLFYRRERAKPQFPQSVAEVPAYLRESPIASVTTALVGGFAVGLISRALERKKEETPVEKISSGTKALAVAAVPLAAGLARRFAAQAARTLSARALHKAGDWIKKRALPVVLLAAAVPAFAAEGNAPARDAAAIEDATRLQIFLDRANFGPGKIDGRGGEFTQKALARYRQSQGGGETPVETKPAEPTEKKKKTSEAPDITGLDLAAVDPVFIDYSVVKEDLDLVKDFPKEPEGQAKLNWLGYTDSAEGIAEKFHCDVDFLKELNPEADFAALKEGDKLRVPNVEPFEVAQVKELKPGSEIAATSEGDQKDASAGTASEEKKETGKKTGDDAKKSGSTTSLSLFVSTKEGMVELREGEQIRAAFPITSGSEETASPVGDWKIQGVATLPDFRYDKKMLKEGERSSDFHLLPPGPNNPVGVVWIALNKKGIGLHGTDSPDTIGRSASHGCIRLANWDIVKLARMVKAGVPTKIE
ncbi:MAG TPA: YhjD/YihY/BrkB family envelope integrity protein [Chthoniobacteraceae bacterium]|jgi:membrane protein